MVQTTEEMILVTKYGVYSGLYFPKFRLNKDIFGVNCVFSLNTGKYRLEETPYLDIFHAVTVFFIFQDSNEMRYFLFV